MAEDEVTYTRPTSLVALERQSNAEAPAKVVTHQPGQQVIDNGGYVGVDPVYQNAANETDVPYAASEGEDKAGEASVDSALDRVQADGKTDVEPGEAARETSIPERTPEQVKTYEGVAGLPAKDEGSTVTSAQASAEPTPSEPGPVEPVAPATAPDAESKPAESKPTSTKK